MTGIFGASFSRSKLGAGIFIRAELNLGGLSSQLEIKLMLNKASAHDMFKQNLM
tara:strand:+ start:283 stop:444 length:162 start_codon:yes stop_codon:yes gene_type:complete